MGDEPKSGWCGKTTKHGSHFYQNPHDGRTWWCPGYTPIT